MPLYIENDYCQISLRDIKRLMRDGYSVMRSPHVGNQHPSSLVCAALGIPLTMTSFINGDRDEHYHPYVCIQGGEQRPLVNGYAGWLPFAKLSDGSLVTEYHQASLRQRFPGLDLATDMQRLREDRELSERVLRVATAKIDRLWYRKVDADGNVAGGYDRVKPTWAALERNIFEFSNEREGWLVPLRAHLLAEFVRQCLGSGRDIIYHLSGSKMIGYIGGKRKTMSAAYDALRSELPELPEQLTVRMVPISAARFVALRDDTDGISFLEQVMVSYDGVPYEERRHTKADIRRVGIEFPKLVESPALGRSLSQYDITSKDDLVFSDWMLENPLGRVRHFAERFSGVR